MARRKELDLAKGFGIVCVVLSHMHFGSGIVNKFLCVYILIFFVVTGILYKSGRSPLELLKRRFPGLMVPYFVFGGGYLALYAALSFPNIEILTSGLMTLLVFPTRGPVGESTLWFLPVFLVCSVMYCALDKACKSPKTMTVAVCALGLLAIASSYYMSFELPWGIASACAALIFFHLGVLIERHRVLERIESQVFANAVGGFVAMTVVGAIDIYAILFVNDRLLIRTMEWGIAPVSLATGMVTCIWSLLLFRQFDRMHTFNHVKAWLCTVSLTSAVYMCINHPVIRVVKFALRRLFAGGIEAVEPVYILLTFILSMTIMWFIAKVITNTRLRIILGK